MSEINYYSAFSYSTVMHFDSCSSCVIWIRFELTLHKGPIVTSSCSMCESIFFELGLLFLCVFFHDLISEWVKTECICSSLLLIVLGHKDLKSALGKKRRDGKSAPPQPLTVMQRLHVSQLVEKYGDDYQVGNMNRNRMQALVYYVVKFMDFFISLLNSFAFWQRMFMDTKLNTMQHSVSTLEKLCKRYHLCKDRNPLILPNWQAFGSFL